LKTTLMILDSSYLYTIFTKRNAPENNNIYVKVTD